MRDTRVCRCGFGRRAAAAGYGRLLLASALAVTAIAEARGHFPGGYETVTSAALWVLLALTSALDVATLWANDRLEHSTGRPHRMATGAWPWLFLLIAFMAVTALFAADQPVLAIIAEIYVLARVVIEGTLAGYRAGMLVDDDPDTLDPEVTRRCMWTAMRYAAFGLVAALCATTWMATGTAPGWAESTVLAALWIVTSALLFGVAAVIWRDMVADYLPPQQDDSGAPFLKEPKKGLEDLRLVSVGWAGWWLAHAGLLLLVYELTVAGDTALAAMFVPLLLMTWAVNTERMLRLPEDRRDEIGQPYLALHAAVRGIARGLHLAIATPARAVRRVLGRKR
jgi:hypothetical protein